METYTLSGIRSMKFPTVGFETTTGHVHTMKFRNSGKKRTAIIGFAYGLNGYYNETAAAHRLLLDVYGKEYALNRKIRDFIIAHYSIEWMAGATDVPKDMSRHTWFPYPMLVKDADVTLAQFASGTLGIGNECTLYVANAKLKDDMGDYYESTHLNQGQRRAKVVGAVKASPYKKGGYTYG